MMLRTLLALVLTTQVVSQEILIKPRLAAGDEFTLEVTRSREDAGKPDNNFTTRTPVTVKVLSANKNGFVIDWRPGMARMEGPGARIDPAFAMAANLVGDASVKFVLGPDGEIEGVENEAELTPKFERLIDVATREGSKNMSAEEAQRFQFFMKQMLSPTVLLSLVSRDAETYLSLHGVALAPGESAEGKLEQPNPFGGRPIPAVFKVRMTKATPDAAMLETATTFDADTLLQVTMQLLEQGAGKPAPEEVAKARMDLSDEGTVRFDRKVGLISEVTNTRAIAFGPAKRTERWVIKLVTPPKR
jgi:hypothetical protein